MRFDENQYLLSANAILERVDEYSIYCKYLGFEPALKTKYNSFIRQEGDEDSNPSFSLFEVNKPDVQYFWKDSGLGEAGDIFKLIKIKFGFKTYTEVYEKIDFDFKLGYGSNNPVHGDKIVLNSIGAKKPDTRIRIASKEFTGKELAFWQSFGISLNTLLYFRVKAIKYYWMTDFQEIPSVPRGMMFGYSVLNRFKLYQPFVPAYKFRNDFTEQCVEGFAQLKYEPELLIITKSLKDVMVLYEFGYEAISPRSENTVIPQPFLAYLRQHYKRIVILFDNDMKHKGDAYNEPKIYVPIETGEKDISDYRKRYGEEKTKILLKTILNT